VEANSLSILLCTGSDVLFLYADFLCVNKNYVTGTNVQSLNINMMQIKYITLSEQF